MSTPSKFQKLSIAIVVQGRFHAFAVAKELLKSGHDVHLFTTYPKFLVKKFGFPVERVTTFSLYFFLEKLAARVPSVRFIIKADTMLASLFGRWAAKAVPRSRAKWDVVIGFSGLVKELWEVLEGTGTFRVLERGSSHIRAQAEILEAEARRAGEYIGSPTKIRMEREEAEYAMSERIRVLSKFAAKTFVEKGVPAEKVLNIPLGVDRGNFVAPIQYLEARKKRILAGQPLRVLYAGVFSYRKGAVDFEKILKGLDEERFQFRFVGKVAEAKDIAERLSLRASFEGPRPESELPRVYDWADVFILPTVEDGFSLVLVQALASGVPIITTENCAGPELVDEGKSGWVVPIRKPEAFIKRLEWCDSHRKEFARMLSHTQNESKVQDWSTSVKKLEEAIQKARLTPAKKTRRGRAA